MSKLNSNKTRVAKIFENITQFQKEYDSLSFFFHKRKKEISSIINQCQKEIDDIKKESSLIEAALRSCGSVEKINGLISTNNKKILELKKEIEEISNELSAKSIIEEFKDDEVGKKIIERYKINKRFLEPTDKWHYCIW